MESIFSKPVTDITTADLQRLIGLPESDRLECKREAYKRDDEGTREMLRDISAMANSTGGYLVIGAAADAAEKIVTLAGIENGEPEALRMISCCRASIEEQILGLHCQPVSVAPDRHVLIWHVPRSTRRPHMVTFKGMYQCWTRHGTRKDKMSIEEIREACLRTENIRVNLERFIAHRREVHLPSNDVGLLLTATPLVVRDEVLDSGDGALRTILQQPPYRRASGWALDFHGTGKLAKPTLYGLKIELPGHYHVEVFRNGHVEAAISLKSLIYGGGQSDIIHPVALPEYCLSFLHTVRSIVDHTGITEPLVLGLSLPGAYGRSMRVGLPREEIWSVMEPVVWEDGGSLELPPMQFSYPLDPEGAARALCDRLWNAFGQDHCPAFGSDGAFLFGNR